MPNQVGYVDDSAMLAHYKMLETIKDFCAANGWTILRYDTAPANRELIMSAPGYTGADGAVPAYVGIRTYQDVGSDYYNLLVAGFTGYVSGNSFDTQPGIVTSGVPAHNQRIDYWMTVNDRRLALAMKVGTPVYESAYLGYCLPYATPRQYPYPLVVGGMLIGAAATRFSDTAHSIPYKGGSAGFRLRFVDGAWKQPKCWPWLNSDMGGATTNLRPLATYYPLLRVVLTDWTDAVSEGSNLYGELDGIFTITGFNNVVENTLTVGGVTYVVIQDVGRNGFDDYYAMRLDA